MDEKKKDAKGRKGSLSLHPLTPDEALERALTTKPPAEDPRRNTPSNKPPTSKSSKKKK